VLLNKIAVVEADQMDAYFAFYSRSTPIFRDIDFLWNRMVLDSRRLFKDQIDLELLTWASDDDERKTSTRVTSISDLLECWGGCPTPDQRRQCVYILRQEFTWDYLCVDRDALFRI